MVRRARYSKVKAKAEWKTLITLLSRYLAEHGARRQTGFLDERDGGQSYMSWIVPTYRGPLRVSLHVQSEPGVYNDWLTIFGQWDDPSRAPYPANPYSGKWNLHGGTVSKGTKGAELFEEWRRQFEGALRT